MVKYILCVVAGLVICNGLIGEVRYIDDSGTVGIENDVCRIIFDRNTGNLRSLINLTTGDDCLKGGSNAKGAPFRIYQNFSKEYELTDDPAAISGRILRPADCKLIKINKKNGLTLVYNGGGLEATIRVILKEDAGDSEWSLQIKNISPQSESLMVSFPCFEGVVLGTDSTTNLQTRHKGDSTVVPAWAPDDKPWESEYYLNMQWHAIWDPASRNVMGLIFKDANALPKKLLLKDKNIELFYYPPRELTPGKTLKLPAARVFAYKGSWRAVARAYRQWYSRANRPAKLPQWVANSDSWMGFHFAYGQTTDYSGIKFTLPSFRDLAATNIRVPFDNSEFAFYCQGSADYGTHTDGTNIVRRDMGGADALKNGIAAVHRLGLHTTLYIEGYIVPNKSDLMQSGRARPWRIMSKDGTFNGPYNNGDCSHMCPGCAEWQDHLADTAARLLRETGADGVRLDSLGYWYVPCYNPEHHHKSPFDYNIWMKELLGKVRKAVIKVNPNAILTTEAAMDWYGQWFYGSLIQRYSREVPPIRLAVTPYRPFVYAGGPVWGSLSGLAGGRFGGNLDLAPLDKNWLCARFGMHKTLVFGEIADDDPATSDSEIIARCFQGDKHFAIVTARPACQLLTWPDNVGLGDRRSEYYVTVAGLKNPIQQAVVCDIETQKWFPLPYEQQGDQIRYRLLSNWAIAIFVENGGPAAVAFDEPCVLHAGESVSLPLQFLSDRTGQSDEKIVAAVTAPGLKVSPANVAIPGKLTIEVPAGTLPGYYAVTVTSPKIIGFKRIIKIE